MQNNKTLAILLTALIIAPAISFAEGAEDVPDLSAQLQDKGLGLTADQKVKIKAIREENKANFKAEREKVKSLRSELKDKVKGDTSSADLTTLFNSLQGEQQKMKTLAFEKMLKIREILTPAQRAKMREFFENHFNKEGRGKWASKESNSSSSAAVKK